MKDVLAFGEALIDFLTIDDDGYPLLKANPGGAPCNFLTTLAHFNKDVSFCGKVGDDGFGHLLYKTLKDQGIDVSHMLIDNRYFTTLAFVLLDQNGDRSFSFARKPGADMMYEKGDIDYRFIDDHKIIYFGGVSLTKSPIRDTLFDVLEYAKEKLIAFDFNLRLNLWDDEDDIKKLSRRSIEYADIIKLSDEEVTFMYGDLDKAKTALTDKKIVFITLGDKGAMTLYKGELYRYEGQKVDVVDTTGAGDIFFGTAISKLLDKDIDNLTKADIDDIAITAIKASAISCKYEGGISSVSKIPNDLLFDL